LRWHVEATYSYQFNADGVCADGDLVLHCRPGPEGVLLAEALDISTGKTRWSTPVPGVQIGKKLPPRFAGVIAGGRWCVSIVESKAVAGTTVAFDLASGAVAWQAAYGLATRSRPTARKGVVVINNEIGVYALDPLTGKLLWESPVGGGRGFYQFPLTDAFLDSHGEHGRPPFPLMGCRFPVWADGLWWCHDPYSSYSSCRLLAIPPDGVDAKSAVWSRAFLSNACPSPAFAYGRLYYAANGEGVVHCFVAEEMQITSGIIP
jgi:outer membrane protein assembly factor BamB